MPEQTPQLSPKELKQLRDHYASVTSAYRRGYEEGFKEGVKLSIQEEKLRIAARMISLGLPDILIHRSTELSLDHIKKLPAHLQQGGTVEDFPLSL